MRVLGALLAGGKSSRFGSDKVNALLSGRRLIDHALAALREATDDVVVCGRHEPGLVSLDDLPEPGLGPLGGLNAAFQYAAAAGYDLVLSVPVDVHPLPHRLPELGRERAPRYLEGQYTIGVWPTSLALFLNAHIAAQNRSVRSWIAECRATAVDWGPLQLVNVNRPTDMSRIIAEPNFNPPPFTPVSL